METFLIMFGLYGAYLCWSALFLWKRRSCVDEMHGMMIGMTYGMLAGLITATMLVIPTGNFLWGVILGSLSGLAFGLILGHLGGHMGLMEGIMAGPMGGMMGAMLGQMIRPFDIDVFMPFFSLIVVLTLIGIVYSSQCASTCMPRKNKTAEKPELPLPFLIAGIGLIVVSVLLSFSLQRSDQRQEVTSPAKTLTLPAYMNQVTADIEATTTVNGPAQNLTLSIGASRYTPNVIHATSGKELVLTLVSEPNAGCTTEIVFPTLNVNEIVPAGTSKIVRFGSLKPGVYPYRCSMDMVHGKIVVG